MFDGGDSVRRPWPQILLEGRADAAIGGIAIAPETRAGLAFSEVYLRLPGAFATEIGSDLEVSPPASPAAGFRSSRAQRTWRILAAYFAEVAGRCRLSVARGCSHGAPVGPGSMRRSATACSSPSGSRAPVAAGRCSFAGGPYLDSTFLRRRPCDRAPPGDEALRATIDAALAALDAADDRRALSALFPDRLLLIRARR